MKVMQQRNAFLANRLKLMISNGQSEDLMKFMNTLSNAEFRLTGPILANDVLVHNCSHEIFWHLFYDIVSVQPKAFLGTFLKAAVKRYSMGSLHLVPPSDLLQRFAQQASTIDCKKILQSFLPILKECKEVHELLRLFGPEDSEALAALLLKYDTKATYYSLFQVLRKEEGNSQFLKDTALKLMHKGTPRSFRMAAIMQAYFALDQLPGRLSLKLQPCELSLFENSEKFFLKIIG